MAIMKVTPQLVASLESSIVPLALPSHFTIVMIIVQVTPPFRVSLESSIMPLVVSFTLLEACYNCHDN